MRILVVGAGGVGSAVPAIAQRRDFFEHMTVADVALGRAQAAVERLGEPDRFAAAAVDASDEVGARGADPRPRAPTWSSTPATRASTRRSSTPRSTPACHYLDMAMTLSRPHPDDPYEQTGVMLGDAQFAAADAWARRGLLALVGMGVEPGLSDVFARYAADHLFSAIDEIGVRDGADLVVEGYDFAPTFSIWTTIEECLNPPLVWERDRGWFTTAAVLRARDVRRSPRASAPIECVNVEHEEVSLIPRWVDCERVTFKYGLGDEFIDVLQDAPQARARRRPTPVRVRGVEVAPRDVVAAVLPEPGDARRPHARPHLRRHVGDRHRHRRPAAARRTCTTWSTTSRTMARVRPAGRRVADRDQPGRRARAARDRHVEGAGVLGPEAFDAVPFLDLLADYGSPHGVSER